MTRQSGIHLTRKVRVALDRDLLGSPEPVAWTNNWIGGPSTDNLVPFAELSITIADSIDERTGYIQDIAIIDQLVRVVLQEWRSYQDSPELAARWLQAFTTRLISRYPRAETVFSVELAVSPQWSFLIQQEHPSVVIVTRQYEFSAAHRLHASALTAEENRALYGKCNSYHGHGHNYLLDVAIAGELDEDSSMVLPAAAMDGIVKERVLARLDHCYLNREVDPFGELNPTVENIARTIWEWLDGAFAPARLQRLRLYETAKTWVDVDRERLAAQLPTAQ